MQTQRALTPAEEKALRFLQTWETFIENRKHVTFLWMTAEALDAFHKSQCAKPIREEWNGGQRLYKVYLDVPHGFRKYVQYVADMAGLKVQVDGSILTHDNLTVTLADIH